MCFPSGHTDCLLLSNFQTSEDCFYRMDTQGWMIKTKSYFLKLLFDTEPGADGLENKTKTSNE